MRRGSLFLHLAFLFSLQVSGHLSFALTRAENQEQKTYSSSPEVKVPGQAAGLVERVSVGAAHPADPKSSSHRREVNKRLQDLRSCLSPKQRQDQDHLSQDDEVVLLEGPVLPRSPRRFQLKVRCRADLIRLPVTMVSA